MESKNMAIEMEALYTDLSSSTGLASAKRLYEHVKNKKMVTDFLSTQESYTLHKPVVRRFRRRRYVVKGLNDLVQMDLADMSSLSRWNGGVKFLLIWIDCYSRYLKVVPLKNKSAVSVAKAVSRLLQEQKPKHIQTDKGTEFTNAKVQRVMAEHDVNFYTTQDPDTKAAFAERVIRTLKSKIYRYMTLKSTKRYVGVLPALVNSYNSSKHRSIGMAPKDVTENSINITTSISANIHHRFTLGQRVRIALEKTTFSRGYTPNWSRELFWIAEQLQTDPPTYKIKDASGEVILGSYYEPELQAV
jgi:transposase InsO family protein